MHDSIVTSGFMPSFPELRLEDLAAISGFSVSALNMRRHYGKPPASTKQKKVVLSYSGRNQSVTYRVFEVEDVRVWLTDERPSRLPALDAWITANTKAGV